MRERARFMHTHTIPNLLFVREKVVKKKERKENSFFVYLAGTKFTRLNTLD